MRLSRRRLAALGALAGLQACAPEQEPRQPPATPSASASPTSASSPAPARSATPTPSSAGPTREAIVEQFQHSSPTLWSDGNQSVLPGLVRRTGSDSVALTLDACGGKHGSRVDHELLRFLRSERIPAVVFLNKRWVEANPTAFSQLADEPALFEIGNHGTRHVPLSVTGRSQYGIAGTRNAGEVYDEIMENHTFLTRELGTSPRYFRTGTAWYDDVAVKIVRALGEFPSDLISTVMPAPPSRLVKWRNRCSRRRLGPSSSPTAISRVATRTQGCAGRCPSFEHLGCNSRRSLRLGSSRRRFVRPSDRRVRLYGSQ